VNKIAILKKRKTCDLLCWLPTRKLRMGLCSHRVKAASHRNIWKAGNSVA